MPQIINCILLQMHLSLQCRHLAASHISHSRSARSRLVTMAGKASKLMVGGHVVEGISIAGQASFSEHPPNCMAGHIIRPVTHKLMQPTAWLNLDTQQPVWECQHTLHSNLRHSENLFLCLQEFSLCCLNRLCGMHTGCILCLWTLEPQHSSTLK